MKHNIHPPAGTLEMCSAAGARHAGRNSPQAHITPGETRSRLPPGYRRPFDGSARLRPDGSPGATAQREMDAEGAGEQDRGADSEQGVAADHRKTARQDGAPNDRAEYRAYFGDGRRPAGAAGADGAWV